MPGWENIWPYETVLTPVSPQAFGFDLHLADSGAPAAAVWPSANLALYFPITLDRPTLVSQLAWCNGGVSGSANIDVGIYDYDLARLASAGSTTQAGANAMQVVNITDLHLMPGRYYLAMACSVTATATFVRYTGVSALTSELLRSLGCFQEASALPLPATATPAAFAQNYVPVFGAVVGKVL